MAHKYFPWCFLLFCLYYYTKVWVPRLIKFNEPFETMLQIYEATYLKQFKIASKYLKKFKLFKILQILLILYFN